MNTDKVAINWQNFARVRLQLKFAVNTGKELFASLELIFFEFSSSLLLEYGR